VALIKKYYPEVNSLRDVSLEMLQKSKQMMDPTIYRRCKYVVEENDRVLDACRELEKGDLKAFGSYMIKTHAGLSQDYEVSCRELDYLVELVKDNPHVYGSRMMGGGFGGCTINLIETNHIEQTSTTVIEKYKHQFKRDLKTYVTSIGSGTNIIAVNEHATV
jgi:galactokinase